MLHTPSPQNNVDQHACAYDLPWPPVANIIFGRGWGGMLLKFRRVGKAYQAHVVCSLSWLGPERIGDRASFQLPDPERQRRTSAKLDAWARADLHSTQSKQDARPVGP